MIPKKLKVGGFVYKIVWSQEPIINNGNSCYGLCDYGKRTITLKTGDFDKQTNEENFCHEMCHATLDEANVTATESEVIDISRALYQVLKDNKIRFE